MREKENVQNNLLVSFSGGETSAMMCDFLIKNYSSKYNLIFVFANTGEENEETLEFVDKCDKYFNLNLIWVEAQPTFAVRIYGKKRIFYTYLEREIFLNRFYSEELRELEEHKGKTRYKIEKVRSGTIHKVVDFKNASRKGEPFKKCIDKYMIPNIGNNWCTRELKLNPITHYMRSKGYKKNSYSTAVGIRADQIDRISKDRIKNKLIYPFIEFKEIIKKDVNTYWNNMPFRLNLKGYEGNCKVCWKKSFRKLGTIAIESPEKFNFVQKMEHKYENFISEGKKHNKNIRLPIRFYRSNKSVEDIKKLTKNKDFRKADDDSVVYNEEFDLSNGCIESCELY